MRFMAEISMKSVSKFLFIFMLVFVAGNPAALLQAAASPPSAAEVPSSPKGPCEDECATKCSQEEYSLYYPFCYRICTQRCTDDIPPEWLYDCTKACAKSIPELFISDMQKLESYLNACYKYCLKNAIAYRNGDDDDDDDDFV